MNGGYWTISILKDIPIRLHWSVLVGAFVFGRFNFVPAYWAGFVLLILLHELGHAVLVKRYHLGVREIMIHGLGGHCAHDLPATSWQNSVIAWGGVLAQGLAYATASVIGAVVGPITSSAGWQLFYLFTESNLWLICLNLVPVAPLDGKAAWAILPQLRDRLKGRSAAPRDAQKERREEVDAAARAHQEAQKLVRDLLDRTKKQRED